MTLLLLAMYNGQSQSIQITEVRDKITGETSLSVQREVFVSNRWTIGIVIAVFPDLSGDHILQTRHHGLGKCCEKNELVIILEDGNKWKATAANEYNCDGEGAYWMTQEDLNFLKSSPMDKVSLTNGVSKEEYTGDVPSRDKSFFEELYYALRDYQSIENMK